MDKVALVTAATSDLGKAIVLELAELIKGVAVHYQTNREKALKLVQELKDRGLSAVALAADLTKAGEAARLVKEVERLLGRLDILVNNYGPLLVKPWTDCTPAEVETLWRANVLSAWETMQAALPGMRRRQWGRIVNLGYSRVDELRAFPTIAPYAMAKTSLLILTRTAARTEAASGITVNMVSPGIVEGAQRPADTEIPAGRFARPEDVARAVKFFVTEEAAYITGANLVVAGGWKL